MEFIHLGPKGLALLTLQAIVTASPEAYTPPTAYPTLKEVCGRSAAWAKKHAGAANVYRRPQCLDPGSYYEDAHGARHTNATGFYAYGGARGGVWRQAGGPEEKGTGTETSAR